jgi:Abnormal spindle-like microcephaly-assoc'd, ASPM-SPD-2-Hydin/Lactonase, 7-bladed beta-propeller
MAQQAPLSSPSLPVSNTLRIMRLLLLQVALAATAAAQTPQQQYVFGSVPVTSATSQVAAYAKNGQNGALSGVAGSPFADNLQGGAMAIDGLGRFLFVINTSTSNISMFQIDQSTGSLTEVPGSPFSTGSTENLSMAPTSPVCLAAERSGQFLYVGYQFGNFSKQGAINEYLIDAANRQLVPLAGQPTTDIASSPIGMVTDPRGLHLYVGLGLNAWTGMQDAGTNVYSIDPVTGILGLSGTAGNAISAGHSIAIDPRGRFFFDGWGATLGTIDSALISPADGTALTGISSVSSASQIPGAMLADSSGKFLYVQQGSAPVVYAIDQTTGALAVPPAALAVFRFSPGSAAADPLGPYIYSLQQDGVHGFLVDTQSGDLSEVPGSPFGGTVAQGMLAITGGRIQAVSGPVAAIFPASENFGSVTVGQSSNSKLVTLTNTGDQALSLNSINVIGANPSDFVATPNCSLPTVVLPNATCSVSLVFSPTAAGARQASLAAANNAPGSPQTIPLSGFGASPVPAVTLAPGSLAFATIAQGSTSPAQTITVTSAGTATLHISSVLPSGANPADFQITGTCSGAYPVASTCDIAVTFSPLGAGRRTANLTINDDAPDSPQSVQLSGTGAAPPPGTPVVKLAPNNVSFGTVTQGAVVGAQIVTLTSSGTGPLHVASVALGGTNSSDFSLTNHCTAAAYAVGANCTIGVSLSPLVTGTRAAFLTITDDAPNSPQAIGINATINAALAISPAAPGSNSVTVTAGQTAAFNMQLTPGSGFTGTASFACAGVPAAATCTAPNVQFGGGGSISYVVSVSTTKGTMIVAPPHAPQLPPFVWLHVFSMAACCGIVVLLLHASKLRVVSPLRGSLRVAAFALLASLCVIEAAGCGGGATSAGPQSIPTPSVIGTPQGTSIITLTPSVTTSTGTPLSGIAPIQLTLTVQ